jgi:hypothetical protein
MTTPQAIMKASEHISLAIFLGFFWLALFGNKK